MSLQLTDFVDRPMKFFGPTNLSSGSGRTRKLVGADDTPFFSVYGNDSISVGLKINRQRETGLSSSFALRVACPLHLRSSSGQEGR